MMRFKVLVVQRGKAFIAYPSDVKVAILGTSKKEVLRKSQLAILDEVKKREEKSFLCQIIRLQKS